MPVLETNAPAKYLVEGLALGIIRVRPGAPPQFWHRDIRWMLTTQQRVLYDSTSFPDATLN